jgi:hypothetical protein
MGEMRKFIEEDEVMKGEDRNRGGINEEKQNGIGEEIEK